MQMIKAFLGLSAMLTLVVLGIAASDIVESKGAKWLARLSGVALAVLVAVVFLPDGLPQRAGTYVPPAKASTQESKDLTLRNVQRKGDSVDITCTGTTGNIVCKPR